MINLKKIALLSTALVALSSNAFAAPITYVFENNHTSINWSANHFGFSNPSGKFVDVQGSVILDEESPNNSSVKATIKTASIVTGIDKFTEHLKSADFFNVSKFPSATFVSDKVEIKATNKAKVYGQLTLLGVTKPVILDVVLNKIGENPMNKIITAGFSATTILKRSEFGINYAIPGVSDEVELKIEVEAQKQ